LSVEIAFIASVGSEGFEKEAKEKIEVKAMWREIAGGSKYLD